MPTKLLLQFVPPNLATKTSSSWRRHAGRRVRHTSSSQRGKSASAARAVRATCCPSHTHNCPPSRSSAYRSTWWPSAGTHPPAHHINCDYTPSAPNAKPEGQATPKSTFPAQNITADRASSCGQGAADMAFWCRCTLWYAWQSDECPQYEMECSFSEAELHQLLSYLPQWQSRARWRPRRARR